MHRIELRGGAHILSADAPVHKGRLVLFHRYPDGMFLSVSAGEVTGVATTTVEEPSGPRPGDAIDVGPTGEGRAEEAVTGERDGYAVGGYGNFPYLSPYYGFGFFRRPRRPAPAQPPPRMLIGPNGFPLAPGSPPPPAIGPNGFPILAPPPSPPRSVG